MRSTPTTKVGYGISDDDEVLWVELLAKTTKWFSFF